MTITLPQMFIATLLLGVLWYILRHRIKGTCLDNIPGPKAQSWWTGNFEQLLNPNAWDFHAKLAEQYGQVVSVQGLFGEKWLYTFDPKVMHSIFLKDQEIFQANDVFINGNRLVFGYGLLGTLGEQHRKQRKMLNPVFSAAHMRDMVPIFNNVVDRLRSTLRRKLEQGPATQEAIDILAWMGRTALELIGQSGLGFSFDPLEDDESTAHPYSRIVKELLPTTTRLRFIQNFIMPWLSRVGPPAFRRFLVNITPSKDVQQMRDMTDYMWSFATEIYEGKKRALEKGDEALTEQVGMGKDIMNILMKANMVSSVEDKLEEHEVIGQISTLVFGAMDTTSTAMSRMLHLLAMHPHVQTKLRQELVEARENHGGDLSYDDLVALPYLDAVCRETLRLHPPFPLTPRIARKDVVVPLHTPITGVDGTEMREIFVGRGTQIWVPALNANRNVALWGQDATEWKPERWLRPLPEVLTAAHIPGVYSNLMTFIGGGRSCIGFKFSQLEMKVVMSALISTFEFGPSEKDSELTWQMNIISSPAVGQDKRPQLPLTVSLVKGED